MSALGICAREVVGIMGSFGILRLILVVGITIVVSQWLLHKLAPSKTASRLQAKYGLLQQYPRSDKALRSSRSLEEGVMTEYV